MRFFTTRPLRDILAAAAFLGVVVLLVFSAIRAYRAYISSPPYVDEEWYPVRGIDISRHNGHIEFEKVKEDGIDFVFIKASEGVSHQDSEFLKNFNLAKENGLKTGAYHFFRFDGDGVLQARNFLAAIGDAYLDMDLVVDVEQAGNPKDISKDDIKNRLTTMVEYLNLLGYKVMVYTNLNGYYEYIADTLPGYPLWICSFQSNPINADWNFWQYNHHGSVDGIKGDVDLNAFNGSRIDWQNYLQTRTWPSKLPLLPDSVTPDLPEVSDLTYYNP